MIRVISLLLLVNLMSACSLEKECEDFVKEHDIQEEFSGIIADSYFHTSDGGRGTPTIVLKDGSKHYMDTYGLICSAEVGDSVIKRKGTLRYLLRKEDTIMVFYPECGRRLILDSGRTSINPFPDLRCGKER